jgi:nucleotide-binding universal stress UspA family protein
MLVAVDGSESALRAVEHAVLLAKRASSDLCVLNVQLPIRVGPPLRDTDRSQIDPYLEEQAQPLLDAATTICRKQGVPHRARLAVGEIAQTIVDTAQGLGAEQIVMGSRGMSALPSLMLGSIATKVIHLAQIPVTIVK